MWSLVKRIGENLVENLKEIGEKANREMSEEMCEGELVGNM